MASLFQTQQTAELIRAGGVIAYATEAVYGLGCNPEDAEAVLRILHMKDRKLEKGLILIASQIEQVLPYIGLLSQKEQLAMQSVWPGPTTLILPASIYAPNWITGGRDTIAIRITAHKDVRQLCDELCHPLVSTSANLSGYPAIKHEWQIVSWFGQLIDGIYPSTLGGAKSPSQIRDIRNDKTLR